MTARRTWTASYQHVLLTTRGIINTHPLPLRHLECAYSRLLARGLSPSPDGVEAHLALSRVGAGLATPWLDLFHGRQALG
jgi:hypothetical protein